MQWQYIAVEIVIHTDWKGAWLELELRGGTVG